MSLFTRLVDLRPLRSSPAFRRFWVGSSLSGMGSQLTVVAVYYQVWESSQSPIAVGAVGLAQAIPMVVFGLVGGTLADAVDRRLLVLVTTMGQTAAAALLALQAYHHLDSTAVVLALVAAQATCGALGAPARRTFPARLLAESQVGAGVALNHVSFQVSMLIGPPVAGLVTAAWGVLACYLIDTATFAAALYAAARLPALPPLEPGDRPGVRAIWGGWRFIAGRPVLTGAFLSDVLATVMAMPVALFPMINAERFGGDPKTLGLLFSAFAVGGVVAGGMSGLVVRAERAGAVMLLAGVVWGVALTGFGMADRLWLVMGCLAVAGAADTVGVIARGSIVQLATPDSYRGRVSAVEHMLGVAGPDLGNFRAGLVAGVTSVSFAAISGGVVCVLGLLALAMANSSLYQFRIPTATTSTPTESSSR